MLEKSKAKQATLTIAAVQSTVMLNRQSGRLIHSSACQITNTANWQLVDGMAYSDPKKPSDIANKRVELHQQAGIY